jgi:hypothetical protein
LSLSLVILAAGMSTRYGRLKQLDPVGPSGEALLDYGMFDAWRAGFERIVLVIRRELEEAFRTHLEQRWPGLPVDLVFQDLTRGLGDARVAEGRTKPWGTAHAVLAAAEAVEGAFGASNADDFYGARGYAALAAHLRADSGEQALVGYGLADTLSPHGGVSRGICEMDAHGLLRAVSEVHELRRTGDVVEGRAPDGATRRYGLESPTSMNLWGFTPALFPLLRSGFATFLERHAADPRAEYPISTAVGDLIGAGAIRLRVLPAGDRWMGVTFPQDHAGVVEGIGALVAAGTYPAAVGAATLPPVSNLPHPKGK